MSINSVLTRYYKDIRRLRAAKNQSQFHNFILKGASSKKAAENDEKMTFLSKTRRLDRQTY
jgi:hypothetical protein